MRAPAVLAVIPARLNSRRFPQKVIFPYKGKPLIGYVYDDIRRAKSIERVVVATDSQTVVDAVESAGGEAILTSRRHKTGTDRVAEVARKLGGQIIINVQADNFGLRGAVLDRVVAAVAGRRTIRFATLARRIRSDRELSDPSTVKVVVTGQHEALWFSRWPLPYLQHAAGKNRVARFPYLAHVGVYIFRREALAAYARWSRTPLEKAESLEQLRILEHGESMHVFTIAARPVAVDTPGDVRKLAGLYR